jgi:hypothetical protein
MPNRFLPLSPSASFSEALPVINGNFAQLDNETVTKTFKQANGNAVVEGKLPYDGGYGSLYADTTGTPRILIGIAPDGEIDIGASTSGQDITSLYT